MQQKDPPFVRPVLTLIALSSIGLLARLITSMLRQWEHWTGTETIGFLLAFYTAKPVYRKTIDLEHDLACATAALTPALALSVGCGTAVDGAGWAIST